jgi:homoserine kinase
VPERMHVSAPASAANLGPGFDCLGIALELRNEVTIGPSRGGGIEVEVEGEGVRAASRGPDNLFVRAFRSAGADLTGLRFEMQNRIPFHRGLGSSAATISAGVAAGLAWSGREADPLPGAVALEGHPDNVAAAILGGITLAWSGAEGPAAIRLRSDCPADLVIAVPDEELPTKLAREALPASIAHADAAHTAARAALLVAALESGRTELLGDALDDRLHEPYRAPFVPLLGAVRARLGGLPVYGATISGAGPSVLVWCERGAGTTVAAALADVAPRVLPLPVADAGVVVSETAG